MNRDQIQHVTEVAEKVTWTGAGTGAAGWLLSSSVIGLIGVCVALAGLLVNWYYKAREDKRNEIEWQKRMKALDTKPGDL
jgi:hypothetical protein